MSEVPRKESVVPHGEPPPIFSSTFVAWLACPGLDRLSVQYGLDTHAVSKLRDKSLNRDDVELANNTSDKRRFGDGSYERWYAKSRYPFVLTDQDHELAGLIWFGPEPVPNGVQLDQGALVQEWDTIAFRSYPPYRGKGIMTAFSLMLLKLHKTMRPGRGLWLETRPHNKAGIALYRKLGFSAVGEDAQKNIVMVLDSRKVFEY